MRNMILWLHQTHTQKPLWYIWMSNCSWLKFYSKNLDSVVDKSFKKYHNFTILQSNFRRIFASASANRILFMRFFILNYISNNMHCKCVFFVLISSRNLHFFFLLHALTQSNDKKKSKVKAKNEEKSWTSLAA